MLDAALREHIDAALRASRSKRNRLTRREIEVLRLRIEGLPSRQTADRLYLSKRTVDFHLANAYKKLDAHNIIQAMRKAAALGIIDLPV